ncbi:hypothetical protein MRX96_021962 [Rhipicephalus microplus]
MIQLVRLPTSIMARLLLCLASLVIFAAVHTSTVLIKGNVTVSCLLELKGINASLITEVKGETFARKEKTVPVNVTVVDTVANFEATAA